MQTGQSEEQMEPTPERLPTEAVAALERGQTIEAIKHVRAASGLGLKEAKDLVGRYLDRHPEVRERHAAARHAGRSSWLRWIIALLVIAAAYLAWRAAW
jgi:ribosomal protein L7/L12